MAQLGGLATSPAMLRLQRQDVSSKSGLGEALVSGVAAYKQAKKDKRQKALDFTNTFIKFREAGLDTESAIKASQDLTGETDIPSTIPKLGTAIGSKQEAKRKKQSLGFRKAEADIKLKEARARAAGRKGTGINKQTKNALNSLLEQGEEGEFLSKTEMNEMLDEQEARLKIQGVDVDLLREKIEELPDEPEEEEGEGFKDKLKGLLKGASVNTLQGLFSENEGANSGQTKVVGGITYIKSSDGRWRPSQ